VCQQAVFTKLISTGVNSPGSMLKNSEVSEFALQNEELNDTLEQKVTRGGEE